MIKLRGAYVAVDFDGTCVTHEYPSIGRELDGCIPTLAALHRAGAKLILLTMRSGVELDRAVLWLAERGIPLYAINDNPSQRRWTSSRKVYANIYIDDAALGAPLVSSPDCDRPHVNWFKVHHLLFNRPLIVSNSAVPDKPVARRVHRG